MELRQYFEIVLRWWWLILLAAILSTGTTLGVSLTQTPIYQASTTLQIQPGSNPNADPFAGVGAGQQVATTFVEQIKTPVLLRKVIADLGLSLSVGELSRALTVRQLPNTALISISVESPSPQAAQIIADGVANSFISANNTQQQARYTDRLQELNTQITQLESDIETTQRSIASLPSDPQGLPDYARLEAAQLQTQLSSYQTRYFILLQSAEEFRLAATRYADALIVFSPAELPTVPIRPKTVTNTLLSLVVGLAIGAGIVFLLEYLDDTIKTSDDVARDLALTVLGHVTRLRDVKTFSDSLIAAREPRNPAVEAFRGLRTNLQFAGLGNPKGSLLVTSPGEKEGKSTIVANLAVVLAQAGRRVAVVDTDLRRPTLHKIFDLSPNPGLGDLFLGSQASEVLPMQATQIPNLDLLTSGPLPPNPADLVSSPLMDQILRRLFDAYDVVLLDSPPVFAAADAGILASKVDSVLLVIQAGGTRREGAKEALASLQRVGAKMLGAVLNREQAGNGYGYYYYYHYHSDEKSAPKKFLTWLRHRRVTKE